MGAGAVGCSFGVRLAGEGRGAAGSASARTGCCDPAPRDDDDEPRQSLDRPSSDSTVAGRGDSPSQSESSGNNGGDSGFVDGNRGSIIGVVGVVAFAALAVLAYKLRSTGQDAADGEEPGYERGDLLDGGEPGNLLEWAVKAGNSPRSYAAMFVAAVGGWTLLTLAGYPGIGAAFLFGALLFVMQWFLPFRWPYIESFYDDEPSQSDPESLRFEGLSSDLKVFLTLFAVTFLVLMGLILVGGAV